MTYVVSYCGPCVWMAVIVGRGRIRAGRRALSDKVMRVEDSSRLISVSPKRVCRGSSWQEREVELVMEQTPLYANYASSPTSITLALTCLLSELSI